MDSWQIITQDKRKKENVVWASGTSKEEFTSFMQYAIDSMSNPEKLILLNQQNGVTYDAYAIATNLCGIRKRTFVERMR
jgi:hypothetical protein